LTSGILPGFREFPPISNFKILREVIYKESMQQDDNVTTLADLKNRVARFSAERGWARHHSPKNLSMAIAAEAAELMEHFLWDEPDASRERLQDREQRRQIDP